MRTLGALPTASTLVLSVPLGALLALLLNDRLGRLSLFRLMVLPNVAGWVLIASTGSLGQVIAGRLLLGASIGASLFLPRALTKQRNDSGKHVEVASFLRSPGDFDWTP